MFATHSTHYTHFIHGWPNDSYHFCFKNITWIIQSFYALGPHFLHVLQISQHLTEHQHCLASCLSCPMWLLRRYSRCASHHSSEEIFNDHSHSLICIHSGLWKSKTLNLADDNQCSNPTQCTFCTIHICMIKLKVTLLTVQYFTYNCKMVYRVILVC